MHIVHLLERRFGARAGVIPALLVLSVSGIALGLGLLLLGR